jgi:hypothetical protein
MTNTPIDSIDLSSGRPRPRSHRAPVIVANVPPVEPAREDTRPTSGLTAHLDALKTALTRLDAAHLEPLAAATTTAAELADRIHRLTNRFTAVTEQVTRRVEQLERLTDHVDQ